MAVPTQTIASPPQSPASGASNGLLRFFVLTFAFTWTCFLLAVAWTRGRAPGASLSAGVQAIVLLGTFAPAIVALALTARASHAPGVRALLARLVRWEVGGRWYAFALGYTVAVKLGGAVLTHIVTGAWPRFAWAAAPLLLAATLFSTLVGGQLGEELGWRGFALPRLARRIGLSGASLVLGAIWAAWHLPLFYVHGADTFGQSFPFYLLQVSGLSVAVAWLWWRTRGSLLLTMLMHAAINNLSPIVPALARAPADPFTPAAPLQSWVTLAVLWATAAVLLWQMRNADPAAWER
ncbi:MAG TPA: type II CAAX endopeptidase family protein [Candidatus Eisenbacteria bacterium]|nr:type II CAAX endopeptidase family protein [Candidatus Eisenbacteria bacterium]